NPEIAKYRKVADILRYQSDLLREYRQAYNWIAAGGRFSTREIDYVSKVYKNLLDQSMDNLDELTMVLTASQLRMSDQERLEAIDRLYLDMQNKIVFLRDFIRRANAVDINREKGLNEQEMLKR